MSEQFKTAIERIKRRLAVTASQMRCPHHQQDATVEVDTGNLDTFYIEVFTCCEEFAECVHELLKEDLDIARDEFAYEVMAWKRHGLTEWALTCRRGSGRKAA